MASLVCKLCTISCSDNDKRFSPCSFLLLSSFGTENKLHLSAYMTTALINHFCSRSERQKASTAREEAGGEDDILWRSNRDGLFLRHYVAVY